MIAKMVMCKLVIIFFVWLMHIYEIPTAESSKGESKQIEYIHL